MSAEQRPLNNDAQVLALFAGNPFATFPPKQIRAVLWQYWVTSMAETRDGQLVGSRIPRNLCADADAG